MKARYYYPVIGRFYSNDPVGFRDVHSFNRYAYANNNPYKYIDPDGKCSVDSNGNNVGVCAEPGNAEAEKIVEDYLATDAGMAVEQLGISKGATLHVTTGSEAVVSGDEVNGAKIEHGDNTISVLTIDTNGTVTVVGVNTDTNTAESRVLTDTEIMVHEGNHFVDNVNGLGGTEAQREGRAIDAGNMHKQKSEIPFKRVGHEAWIGTKK
jgi:uncharacterized protein RhaS with RHS repeats